MRIWERIIPIEAFISGMASSFILLVFILLLVLLAYDFLLEASCFEFAGWRDEVDDGVQW